MYIPYILIFRVDCSIASVIILTISIILSLISTLKEREASPRGFSYMCFPNLVASMSLYFSLISYIAYRVSILVVVSIGI
jgi:hypothetical protein